MNNEATVKAMEILALEADPQFFTFVEKTMEKGAHWQFEGEDGIILHTEVSETIIVNEEDRNFEVHPDFIEDYFTYADSQR